MLITYVLALNYATTGGLENPRQKRCQNSIEYFMRFSFSFFPFPASTYKKKMGGSARCRSFSVVLPREATTRALKRSDSFRGEGGMKETTRGEGGGEGER